MFNNRTRRNKTYKNNAFSRIKGIKKAFIHLQITRIQMNMNASKLMSPERKLVMWNKC